MRQIKITYADRTAEQYPSEESYEQIMERANQTARLHGTKVTQVVYMDCGRYAACGALR